FQGGVPLEAAPLLPSGSAFVATLATAAPSGNVWAVYQGDANFGTSTSQAVAAASRALVSIISSRNPAVAGQPLTLTVQVAAGSGAATPSGSVQLASDGITLE